MKARYIAIILLIMVGGFILSAFLSSCRTPKQRHDHLIEKYGKLCVMDTLVIKDTIVKTHKVLVPQYKDSFIVTHDTIIETKKISFKKKGDKFSITVKPDTITFRDTIPYEVKVPGQVIEKKYFNWWYLIVAFLLGMVIAHRLRP